MTPTRTLTRTVIAMAAALSLAAPVVAGADEGKAKSEEAEEAGDHGWLGVRLQRVSGGLAEALDLNEDDGVLIGQVLEESPAEKAGLKSGDIVTGVGDAKVGTPTALRDAIAGMNAGDKVDVRYLRDGREEKVAVTLGRAPEPRSFAGGGIDRAFRGMDRVRDLRVAGKHGYLGVMSQDLDGELGEYFGAKEGGALVTEVMDDSPARKLGLRAGDVIVEVAGSPVEDSGDLRRIVGGEDDAAEVEVVWLRDRKRESGRVELEVREGMGMLGLGDGPHFFEWHGDPHHFDEARRVLGHRFREDGTELREMMDRLREEMRELREEVEELKAD
jgi:S1-C subfamily serine protease